MQVFSWSTARNTSPEPRATVLQNRAHKAGMAVPRGELLALPATTCVGVHTRVFPLGRASLVKLLGPEHSHSNASSTHGFPSAMASGGPSASSASPAPLADPLAMLEAAYGPSIFESVVRCRHC